MAPPVEISIPTATVSATAKPYTLYNITLRLPLRTYTVHKRYSEFLTLHNALLTATNNVAPPSPLPSKTWYKIPFTTTNSSPSLIESRRLGLETYLKSIAQSKDGRWRETSAWRTFLNLPSAVAAKDGVRESVHGAVMRKGGAGEVLGDPTVWLDVHREMKGLLHEGRLQLGRRDSARTAAEQHEAGANAKRCLVKAGTLIASLEEGLKVMSEEANGGKGKSVGGGGGGGASGLGGGELRRRKDLLSSARVEKEGLEKLSANLALRGNQSSSSAAATATPADKSALFGSTASQPRSGRILGGPVPETNKTKELDNEGVLMLQRELMKDQDQDIDELARMVRRQREMGMAIHEELEVQNEMLGKVDQDVDRVQGKLEVARKRVGKIK